MIDSTLGDISWLLIDPTPSFNDGCYRSKIFDCVSSCLNYGVKLGPTLSIFTSQYLLSDCKIENSVAVAPIIEHCCTIFPKIKMIACELNRRINLKDKPEFFSAL